ncbi:triokinase/FMN cyclase-like [Plodia interpunctella]|uniref:triokinase/FMN cyclase-like n=1 Tax=Plodia interpunctella TaxID=58824 RepID=UPI0023684607|nr:triokinase/FMN cyclase-like [Plodia interpunctella]XP_053612323.1 triokinase/FMN cyclase-like [Plodia interpunctella]XP_053612324.1 triokinase/FMN cyclase-like [Plodia interpunctella]XP_053612325.1 triokinase/FMN cyclase-like [Plodia interpunctella]XP_053612326.1 triokinase/FMN cyclase-like [Plodia interpunctella]XP_053612327.1 triokinase/FMN cyclase-like [Plodia interpunctella]
MAAKPVTKKLINSVESCVDDNLRGLVAMYPKLRLHPKHRVVTIRNDRDTGRVAVISGGGSGHEPFASGFIGSGMLDGAIAGGIFASPPTGHVLYAITHLHKYNSGGSIVILGNYTGDRLNFGKAIEKAKIAGVKVREVIVAEDIASSHNKTGGRGLCAEVYLFKLCGAMSAKGYDLDSIHKMALDVCKHMATLGVCLSPCSLPGQPPLFEIAQGEMELGAGVHGEAGIAKVTMGTAKEVTALILEKIVDHLKLVAGDRVTVMLNNLGGTSILEVNIMCSEIKDYFSSKKIKSERIFAGHMKTSLEMHGLHVSVIKLSRENGDFWLELLDGSTDAPGWTGTRLSVWEDGQVGDDDDVLDNYTRKASAGPSLSQSQQELFRGCLQGAGQALVKSESLLNKLDSGCGDGDCGTTIKQFAQAILDYIKQGSVEHPSNVLWVLSEIAEKDMGGTSGGIYSLGLAAASQSFASSRTVNITAWLAAWESGMQAITKYGGAEPGDRTMLDTLHTASVAFKQNLSSDLKTLLRKTGDAAEVGAKATASMTARAGRASYVASGYTRDDDAGARAVAIWLQAIVDFMLSKI